MITRLKKTLTEIPASISEAGALITSIGNKQREINKIKREAKARTEVINAEAKKAVDKLVKERNVFFTSLFAFASARKAEFTRTYRSVKTSVGTFGWRWTTPFVELRDGFTDQDLIKSLKRLSLSQYIRTAETVDREALLRDRPIISGVQYSQRDEFFAKPKLAKEDGRAEELVKTEAIDA